MRLIDGERLVKELMPQYKERLGTDIGHGMGMILGEICAAPTIDPASLRPKGEWTECDWVEYDGHGECIHYPKAALRCSNCCNAFKKKLLWKRNYCPNCGADMRGETNDS